MDNRKKLDHKNEHFSKYIKTGYSCYDSDISSGKS